MKAKLFIYNLLFMTFCVMINSCSSKNEVYTDNAESKELYRIQVGGKCGFINEYGKLVIEPQFDRAYWYFTDSVCFATVGERRGLINADGDFVVELERSIDWVKWFQNGVATFYDTNLKMGLIKKTGEIVLPAIYNEIIRDEYNGFIVEDTLGNRGYVDYDGTFVIPCIYDDVKGFEEGLMVVATRNNCGYVDTTGTFVIDTIYDEARGFGEGIARVKNGDRWKYIDQKGKEVTNIKYDEILTGFSCNRAFVKNENAIELIDRNGTRISIVEADSVYGFNEGYATFKKNGKFGKLDTNGTVVIQPKYEELFLTHNGLTVFVKDDKQGALDTIGNVIVDAIHERMGNNWDDEEGLLLFVDNNWDIGTYYDRKGNLIWKDMNNGYKLPNKPTKEDWKTFFDAKLADMDPIEGLYYVEYTRTYQNRTNPSVVGSNGGDAKFFAVVRDFNTNDFSVYSVDNPGKVWKMKFVKIGDSNKYAIIENDTTSSKYADNSSFVMEDQYKFDFQLETSHNSSYNFYVNYTFTQDYPSASVFEQVQQPEWTGTGFAIADGYVVTNYHVTNGAKTIKVRGVNGDLKEVYKAYVVASDREQDLAIIKIVDKKFEGFDNIPYCIGKSMPEVGDDVFVLGYPMTNTMGQEVKLTNGIISAASGFKGDQSMYQISAPVQPGNSGGPLFDNEGNVIGVVCAKHADAENANYAIKVSYLYSLVNSSGLGIKMSDNNKVKSKSLSQKVKQVKPFVYLIECYSH